MTAKKADKLTKSIGETGLKQSEFWHEVNRKARKYWSIYPTKLHAMEHLFFVNGNGYEWADGKLAGRGSIAEDAEYAPPHRLQTPKAAVNDPAANPLFAAIPDIPPEKFLQSLSDSAFSHAENDRLHSGKVYPLCEYAKAYNMPLNADLHYLAGAMLLLKHAWQHPGVLPHDHYPKSDVQKDIVRVSLNAGFDIIEKRKLGLDFARASADFGKALPKLTALSKRHIKHSDEQYQFELAARKSIEAKTPEEKAQLRAALLEAAAEAGIKIPGQAAAPGKKTTPSKSPSL